MKKEAYVKIKRQQVEWDYIFALDISDKGLISRIFRALTKISIKKNLKTLQKV